jgi:hypothetical protein
MTAAACAMHPKNRGQPPRGGNRREYCVRPRRMKDQRFEFPIDNQLSEFSPGTDD